MNGEYDIGEMQDNDYILAGEIIQELLEYIGATKGRNISRVLKYAAYADRGETEVNGHRLRGFSKDGNPCTSRECIDISKVDWFRMEFYMQENPRRQNGMALMYIYLPLNKTHDAIDVDAISFDVYPDPDIDLCWADVMYRDCLKRMK